MHIIRLVGARRDQRVEAGFDPVPRVGGRALGRSLAVRQREEVEEVARRQQRLDVVRERIVGHRGLGGVGDRAAQRLLRHDLVGHRLHHVGAGDEHVARILHHEDEVGHRRRVDRAARAGAHDEAELRHHAAGEDVALEHLGIAAQARDPLLDAGAARVVEADHRCADLQRHVHHLADLLRVAFRQRAAEHGKVLAENKDQPPVDRARSSDDTVARDDLLLHPEIDAVMLDVHVEFLEATFIEQHVEPFARGQLALGVLRGDSFLAPAEPGRGALLFEFGDGRGHGFSLARPFARFRGGVKPPPFALSLSKCCPSFSAVERRAGLRQAQPERGWDRRG